MTRIQRIFADFLLVLSAKIRCIRVISVPLTRAFATSNLLMLTDFVVFPEGEERW
jgi:hypothetical protein